METIRRLRRKGQLFVCTETIIEGEHEWKFPLAIKGQVFFFNNEAIEANKKPDADFNKHFRRLRVRTCQDESYEAELDL